MTEVGGGGVEAGGTVLFDMSLHRSCRVTQCGIRRKEEEVRRNERRSEKGEVEEDKKKRRRKKEGRGKRRMWRYV